MEQELLQFVGVFLGGVVLGVGIMLVFNKVRGGSASPTAIKQEFESYQNEVERHFEETSRKFKDMTEQYQDLYQHLSIGATSLCRPDSVAAALADQSDPISKVATLDTAAGNDTPEESADSISDESVEPVVNADSGEGTDSDDSNLEKPGPR
jgi:uncharacterized membrane-anchored protein YhcB (DUF1043 family)